MGVRTTAGVAVHAIKRSLYFIETHISVMGVSQNSKLRKDSILRIEMNLSAFGVESDNFP